MMAGGGRKLGGYSHDDIPMVAGTLRARHNFNTCEDAMGGGLLPVVADAPVVTYVPEVAATMVARSSRGGGQTNSPGHQADSELIASAMQVRRLTPMECERLQGFPDGYTAITVRGKPAADGPRYKALGNSWAIPCVRWIGERINAVDSIRQQADRIIETTKQALEVA